MACPKACGVSLATAVVVLVFSGEILLSVVLFLCVHAGMVFMTHKDPYFIQARLVALRCPKTQNYERVRGNRYDP